MIAPTLTTERLTLRALGPQDAAAFAAFYASPRSSLVGGPLSTELSWRALAGELGHWALKGFGRWAVTETGRDSCIGCVGLWEPYGWPEAEIGWDLFDGATGKGYATEAAKAARGYAYDTLGWRTAISLVATGNDASARVATRLGCTPEGPFTHPRFGTMTIYRHPAPEALAA
jgi:RimJ/RimL family protein N-acetyltransferase